MALFAYVTDECREEAEHHGFSHALDNFASRVESSQDTRHFDPFPPPFLVKKQFGGRQGRLIAARETIRHAQDDHTMIVFLSVMIRGERAYDAEFGKDPETYGHRFFDKRYTRETLSEHIANRMAVRPVQPKQVPSEAEYGYLYQALAGHRDHGDDVVCESEEWVDSTDSAPFKDSLIRLYDAISSAVPGEGGMIVPVPGKSGWGILCRYFPELKVWYMAAPLNETGTTAEALARERHAHILTTNPASTEEILQCCRRAYPRIVLAEESLWLEIQRDPLGNLALSPEETDILENSYRATGGFPLFINGRAGSGKSTILQYLFTDFIYHHITVGGCAHPPVYFACNPELLRHARLVVESLLNCGSKYWGCENRQALKQAASDILSLAFQDFRGHLLSLLPPEVREVRFMSRKRVDYARFRKLWMKKYGRDRTMLRDFSPDLCWHVIRTYIKGASIDELLDPAEYGQIEQKQRSVTEATYEYIYTHVWERWFKPLCIDDTYWDDQDLCRYLVEHEHIKPQFPGIFCDEAQDFTRIELEVILRMSLFSDRSLAPNDIAHVPFVFAGDPFQTINPTGFRWDAVRAWFVEKFIFTLDPSRRSGLTDLNYCELSYNYRSSRQIVGFSNFVQALRSRLFAITGLHPQTAWDDSQAAPVVLFQPNDAAFWKGLATLGDAVFILPCHEGEELEYIADDPVLNKRIPVVDGVPAISVLSAARAKGLEFPRVVVYGFGKATPEALLDPIKKGDTEPLSPDMALPLEYFVNRLYVAVSRPKRQLLIVDDEADVRKLWEFARNPDWELKILAQIRNGSKEWGPKLARLEAGNINHLSSTEPINLIANAQQMEWRGRSESDAFTLKQAAVAYRNAGDDTQALLCQAEAASLEDNFLLAGEMFLKTSTIERAVTSFWRAKQAGWKQLKDAAERCPAITSYLEYAFAECIEQSKNSKAAFKVIQRMAAQMSAGDSRIADSSSVFALALEQVIGIALDSKDKLQLKTLLHQVMDIVKAGIPASDSTLGMLAFKAGEYRQARTLWERIGLTNTSDYRRAKAESDEYPDRLMSWAELHDWKMIVLDFTNHRDHTLQQSHLAVVGKALVEEQRFGDALPLLCKSRSRAALDGAAAKAEKGGRSAVAAQFRGALYALDVEAGDWGSVMRAAGANGNGAQYLDLILARALGRSPSLPDLPGDAKPGSACQKTVSDFLRSRFITPGVAAIPEGVVLEVGAAIERAGNRRDSLLFYEAVRKGPFCRETHDAALDRWIVSKERQVRFDSERGDERIARQRQKEIDEARRIRGIGNNVKLPEYPELSSMDQLLEDVVRPKDLPAAETVKVQARAQPVENNSSPQNTVDVAAMGDAQAIVQTATGASAGAVAALGAPANVDDAPSVIIGDYRIAFFPEKQRLNVEDTKTGETLAIKEAGAIIAGDWQVEQTDATGFRSVTGAMFCIRVTSSQAEVVITLSFYGGKLCVAFTMGCKATREVK